MPVDFKKTEKQFYRPKTTPEIIDVPQMLFLMIDGKGDPNTNPEYTTAVEILYGLSYSIKMSKMGGNQPKGYFDYVVPPLEGLWSLDDGGEFRGAGETIPDKSKFLWTSMIRQPEFVTVDVFENAKITLVKKKPHLDLSAVRLESFTEGLCAQIMHIGAYDDEPVTIAKLGKFINDNGYIEDMGGPRRHHEIYLSDPRKTAPEKLKTVIRHPIKKPR
ncbi:MAG: GyrI-like domain-containing protein [Bacillota bacterium]